MVKDGNRVDGSLRGVGREDHGKGSQNDKSLQGLVPNKG